MAILYCKRLALALIWLALHSCGLPNTTVSSVNNLNKPELKVYNEGNTLYLEITGYYPPSEYEDFIGYNIYVGDNNNVSKVIDRVLYISSDDELPSYDVSLNDATSTVTIALSDIRFRYSKHATADDIPEGVDQSMFFRKPLVAYEWYYFVVEAVEENRTGVRTDAVKTIFVKYQNSQAWVYGEKLGQVDIAPFNDLEVNENFFILPSTTSHSFSMGIGGPVDSVYQNIPADEPGYVDSPFKPYLNHVFFFRAVDNNSSVSQYLILWVEKIETGQLMVSYGHKKEVVPKFIDDGVTQIID